jgi:hypothetical protein
VPIVVTLVVNRLPGLVRDVTIKESRELVPVYRQLQVNEIQRSIFPLSLPAFSQVWKAAAVHVCLEISMQQLSRIQRAGPISERTYSKNWKSAILQQILKWSGVCAPNSTSI